LLQVLALVRIERVAPVGDRWRPPGDRSKMARRPRQGQLSMV
jgi:hypothetical protein